MTPVERAAEALIPYSSAYTNRHMQARRVFMSIDVDELARVITDAGDRSPDYIACVIYDYLTGDESNE